MVWQEKALASALPSSQRGSRRCRRLRQAAGYLASSGWSTIDLYFTLDIIIEHNVLCRGHGLRKQFFHWTYSATPERHSFLIQEL